jgi:phage terminase small subunit
VATKKPKRQEAPPVVPDDVTTEAEAQNLDPLTYMLKIMNDDKAEKERRDRMAIAAAPFVHSRKGEGKGKKEQKADRAKAAGSGKFAPAKPPLALVK